MSLDDYDPYNDELDAEEELERDAIRREMETEFVEDELEKNEETE